MMKRLLSSTTALSLALTSAQPWPLLAQTLLEDGSVIAADGSVLCAPTAEAACNPDDYIEQAQAIEAAMAAQAEAEAQAAAEAEAAAQAEAQAAAEAEAAAQAEAEAQAAAQAEAEAQAAAQAEAEAQAAAQAEAEAQAAAQAEAEAQAAAQAEAEAQAAAQAEAEAQAAAQAEAEAQAAAQAEAEAQAAAQAEAEAQAAAQAEAEAAAEQAPPADEATEEQPAEEQAIPAETATEDAAQPEAPADEAAVEDPATDEMATEEATGEAAATDEAATDEAATDETAAEEPALTDETAAEEAAVEEPAATDAAAAEETIPEETAPEETATEAPAEPEKTAEEIAAEEAAVAAAQEELAVQPDGTMEDPAAGLKTEEVVLDPSAEPVEAPVVTEAEVETLSDILAEPEAIDPAELGAVATMVEGDAAKEEPKPISEMPETKGAVATVVETITETNTRTSSQEFAPPPVQVAPGKKSGLSDLEKVGLVALGALVIGAVINEGNKAEQRQVVSNTGDRVVVLKPDGTYQVYKDDDAVLRRPGSTVRTETFSDGSTRTIVERADGSQVVTIRDASGRVLRRASYDGLGREIVLIDDLSAEDVVIVERLPKPKKKRVTISMQDEDAVLKAKLAAKEAKKAGRKFSLRQVREIPEVRALAATIEVDDITFDSGSAAIKATEADSLADLGGLMQELLEANPAEVFLIEGHTDAVGKAAMNLALSDRRAESVALALTEYFDIPPENMVVQGYGEAELKIDTQTDERRNRRVAVRIITPLLKISE